MLHEGNRLAVQLQTQRLQLDKSKKNYEKAFREAEKVGMARGGLTQTDEQ